jgi:hypothetical protein
MFEFAAMNTVAWSRIPSAMNAATLFLGTSVYRVLTNQTFTGTISVSPATGQHSSARRCSDLTNFTSKGPRSPFRDAHIHRKIADVRPTLVPSTSRRPLQQLALRRCILRKRTATSFDVLEKFRPQADLGRGTEPSGQAVLGHQPLIAPPRTHRRGKIKAAGANWAG